MTRLQACYTRTYRASSVTTWRWLPITKSFKLPLHGSRGEDQRTKTGDSAHLRAFSEH